VFSKWSVSLRIFRHNLYALILSTVRATYPAHLNRLEFFTRVICSEEHK
jgi:hypothetical protein